MKAFALLDAESAAAIVDLPDPAVEPGFVRIRVVAASVNGFDAFEANRYLVAVMEHRFPTVIGRDFAGVVDAVGNGRTDVSVGDEVFGFVTSQPPLDVGTYAESVSEGPRLVIAHKPAGVSFVEAAAMPLAGATALDSIGAIEPGAGDTVLIAGATGGVGTFAVQLAVRHGARVIATARPGEEEDLVRSLGASETVDYGAGDVAEAVGRLFPDGVDALIDLVNREASFDQIAVAVRDGGRIATTLGAADVDGLAARGIRATNIMGTPTREKLESLATDVEAGMLRVAVQGTYSLADATDALAAFSAGTRGKIVLLT
jgi:NADPH:quinone reductase-like Zn-dependent oxidoreductase